MAELRRIERQIDIEQIGFACQRNLFSFHDTLIRCSGRIILANELVANAFFVAEFEHGLKPAGHGVGNEGDELAGQGGDDQALALGGDKTVAVDLAGGDLPIHGARQRNAHLHLVGGPFAERALFLAAHWSHQEEDGRWRIAGDPAHKLPNPTLYRWEEVAECWKRIAAPVLWIQASDTDAHRWAGEQSEIDARRGVVPQLEAALIDDAGHMLHHDQPEQVARLIEAFLDRHRA